MSVLNEFLNMKEMSITTYDGTSTIILTLKGKDLNKWKIQLLKELKK